MEQLDSTLAAAGQVLDPPSGRRAPHDDRNVSLDTLRALAIVMVLCAHSINSYGLPNHADFLGVGGVGVDLFFCLSGWLLGRQLLIEFRNTGSIDVPRFWMRRWMRTLPAYAAVLAATVGQALVQGKNPTVWPYVVFLQNYLGMPFFGVSWSLCVEEYFYLAVAPLVLLVSRSARWLPLAVVLLLVPSTGRLLLPWVNSELGWNWDLLMTHLRYDQCAVGVLLAAAAVLTPRLWDRLVRLAPVLAIVALGFIGVNLLSRVRVGATSDWGPFTWTLIFATFVLLANSSDFWRLRAKVPGARFVANRAYALYLVHPEGIATANRLFGMHDGRSEGPLLLYVLTVWVVAFIGAEVLYRVVERPFMRAREWFAVSRSAKRAAEAVTA